MWKIDEAIVAGAHHLCNNFDSEHDDVPWFEVRVVPKTCSYLYHYDIFDQTHAPGRALDAIMTAETLTSFNAEPKVITKYKKSLKRSLGKDGFLGSINAKGEREVYFHNFRETLLAYNALYRYRGDEDAYQWGTNFVNVISYLENKRGFWDKSNLQDYRLRNGAPLFLESEDPTNAAGRLIYALIQWGETVKDESVLQLASRFAEYALHHCFDDNGNLTHRVGAHVHSITSTYSGICEWLLKCRQLDKVKVQFVEKIFQNTILPLSSFSGWTKELRDRPGMGGEINSTGDIIQALICLHMLTNNDNYLAIAERMIRGHLLPSQVFPEQLPADYIIEPPSTNKKAEYIKERIRGGFGFPYPEERAPLHYDNQYCRITTLDITGGAVQALCKIKNYSSVLYNGTIYLNFLLPACTTEFDLQQNSLNKFTLICHSIVSMRIPSCPFYTVNGMRFDYKNRHKFLPGKYEIIFEFAEQSINETLFGKEYKTYFVGEQVTKMFPEATYSDMFDKFSK